VNEELNVTGYGPTFDTTSGTVVITIILVIVFLLTLFVPNGYSRIEQPNTTARLDFSMPNKTDAERKADSNMFFTLFVLYPMYYHLLWAD